MTDYPSIVYGTGRRHGGRVTKHIVRCTDCTPDTWLEDKATGDIAQFPNKQAARTFGAVHMKQVHNLVPRNPNGGSVMPIDHLDDVLGDAPRHPDAPVATAVQEPPAQAPEASTGPHSSQSGPSGDRPSVPPHDHKQGWDDGDVAELKDRHSQGQSERYIAEHMGRTVKSVASKLYRMRKAGDID